MFTHIKYKREAASQRDRKKEKEDRETGSEGRLAEN